MRCAGSSTQSLPCARADLPATGMTEGQICGALMPCCRAMRHQCAMRSDQTHPVQVRAAGLTLLVTRHCLVTVRVIAVATPQAARLAHRPLTAMPALAPPATVPNYFLFAQTTPSAFWTYSPVLSPHTAPRLHGLRAPPTA